MSEYDDVGFTDETFNYRKDLAKFPLAAELKRLLDQYHNQLSRDGIQKMTMFIETCASPDFVLTNFSGQQIEVQILQLRNAWLTLKASIPKIDSNNQVFSLMEKLIFSSIEPRLLRSKDGFERHTQNETRHSETVTQISPPTAKKFYERE